MIKSHSAINFSGHLAGHAILGTKDLDDQAFLRGRDPMRRSIGLTPGSLAIRKVPPLSTLRALSSAPSTCWSKGPF